MSPHVLAGRAVQDLHSVQPTGGLNISYVQIINVHPPKLLLVIIINPFFLTGKNTGLFYHGSRSFILTPQRFYWLK